MSARGVLRIIEGGRLGFWCPGCKEMHVVTSGWSFLSDCTHELAGKTVPVTIGEIS